MDISVEDFRRHFESLSDEALLATVREDLVELAKECFDVELSSRGLTIEPVAAPVEPKAEVSGEELVAIARCESPEEAGFFRNLLRIGGVPSHVRNALGQIELLVPAALAEEAGAILDASISEEELAAQAEAAAEAEAAGGEAPH
jgi:hypothetical protein